MNKLLERQIKKFFGQTEKVPKDLVAFLQDISETYDGFDQDRELMERSLDLSSQELNATNQKIRDESNRLKEILESLRAATLVLRPNTDTSKEWLTSRDEAIYLANSLTHLISEQKQHEKELEISKARAEQEKAKAEAILQSIGDGVFAVDINAKIMLMNPIAESMSGFTFSESLGKHYKEIFRFVKEKEEDFLYPSFIEEVIEKGKIKKLANHTLLVQKNGTKLSISDSAAPIKNEQGDILGCIVVVRDASRERALEQAKDDFISIAAHQLRTPLGSMRWNLEMLSRTPDLSDKNKERVLHIYKSDLRMITLVNDLLNVSRIDQGRVPDEPELTDIFEIIRSEVRDIDAEAMERSISIDLQLEEDHIPKIMIDPKRFREVVQNLLSNGIKYNKEAGKVTVTVTPLEKSFRLSISDEGMGIPLADQPRVFSKFYRAENAAKSETKGSGLGLFVVKSYVEAWGGTIIFESIEGRGSTFIMELPFEIQSAPINPEQQAISHAEGVASLASAESQTQPSPKP